MNPAKSSQTIHLAITMAGLARVHDRYLRGMRYGVVLGDQLDKDLRWVAEIERILIGSGYYDGADLRRKYLEAEVVWQPAHTEYEDGDSS